MNSENISGTNDAKKGKRALLAKYCITWLSGRLDSDWPFMEKHENLYKCRKKLFIQIFYLALYKDITGVTGYIYFCGYKSQSKFYRNVSSPGVDTQCCWEWESVMLRSAGAVLCMSNIIHTFLTFFANAIKCPLLLIAIENSYQKSLYQPFIWHIMW